MKRQIFLANFSIEAKKDSVQNMHRYVRMQEEALEKQVKLAKESEYLLKSFMKEELDSVRMLKEKHIKLDEEKIHIGDQLTEVRNSIIDEEYAIRKLKNEISVKY